MFGLYSKAYVMIIICERPFGVMHDTSSSFYAWSSNIPVISSLGIVMPIIVRLTVTLCLM